MGPLRYQARMIVWRNESFVPVLLRKNADASRLSGRIYDLS